MKKIGKLLIVLFIVFALCGCGKKTTDKLVDKLSAKNDPKISLGTWSDNTYTNDFLGVTYTMPEGWVRKTDEEILEDMELGAELIGNNAELNKKIAELTTVTYFMTSDINTGNNIILMSEKTFSSNITIDKYMDAVITNIQKVDTINYTVGERKKENINGFKYESLDLSASSDGVTINQRYYVRKNGRYFISVIITSVTGTESIPDMIGAIKSL